MPSHVPIDVLQHITSNLYSIILPMIISRVVAGISNMIWPRYRCTVTCGN